MTMQPSKGWSFQEFIIDFNNWLTRWINARRTPITPPAPTPNPTPTPPAPKQPGIVANVRVGNGVPIRHGMTMCRVEGDVSEAEVTTAPQEVTFTYAWQFGGSVDAHKRFTAARTQANQIPGAYFDPFAQRADDNILLGKTFGGVRVAMDARYKLIDHGTFGAAIVCDSDDPAWRAAVEFLLTLLVSMGYLDFFLDDTSILGQKFGATHANERKGIRMVRFCREVLDRLTGGKARIWNNTGSWTLAAAYGPNDQAIDDGPSSTNALLAKDRTTLTDDIDVFIRENDTWDHGSPTSPGQQETETRMYTALHRVLNGRRPIAVMAYPPPGDADNTARTLKARGIYAVFCLNRPGASIGYDVKNIVSSNVI
jgi:hypothetical protein